MDPQTLAKAIETAKDKLSGADRLGATVLFEFKEGGAVFVDGRGDQAAVREGVIDEDAQCTIKASLDTFKDLMNGELNPTVAFMTGKIKIDGSMGVAMKLAQVLG